MKRMKFVILILLFCILLHGCAGQKNAADINDQLADHVTSSGTLFFYAYEQYAALIDDAKLPANFVYYDALRHFGNFQALRYSPYALDRPAQSEAVQFKYTFVDDVDEVYELSFSSTPPRLEQALTDADIDLSDMRRAKADGFYEIHGVTYIYRYNGHLEYIVWQINGFYCQARMVYSSFEKYPYKQSTAIAKLLELEGKNEKDISAILAGKLTARDVLQQVAHYLPLGIFVGCVAAFVILRRRREQK